MESIERKKRLQGTLLGTAIGDALGLPFEGVSAKIVQRKFIKKEKYYFPGGIGVVSDDTELSALLAQSLIKSPDDIKKVIKNFRISLLGWFLRLPWGIGLGTLRSCLKIMMGFRVTGCREGSAGNGAAMRSAILGVFINDDKEKRLHYGRNLAEITHLDKRAVDGALFVSEVAAILSQSQNLNNFYKTIEEAKSVVSSLEIKEAIDSGVKLARGSTKAEETIKNTGYIVHTITLITYCFLKFGNRPMDVLSNAILLGGDTDSNAAILGAWCGASYGTDWIPIKLLNKLQQGPFGKEHLERLGEAMTKESHGIVPTFSWIYSFIRNLALYPVILVMGVGHIISNLKR